MRMIKLFKNGRRSIFRALFAPLLIVMAVQSLVFYFAAVYGIVEESLKTNASDVLSERLSNRVNEIENLFHGKWTNFEACVQTLDSLYAASEKEYGTAPLAGNPAGQIAYLESAAEPLIGMLRRNEVNGVFLILNVHAEQTAFSADDKPYGLCIRDMDQNSAYFGTEDLLLERAPSSIIDSIGCQLDSWWEAKFSFDSEREGDYYFRPLEAAWANPNADERDLMYCSGVHRLSRSDPDMISCSIPLFSKDGLPYAVLGVELSVKHFASLLPQDELNSSGQSSYVLTAQDAGSSDCSILFGTGPLFNRCFPTETVISLGEKNTTGGYNVTGRGNVTLYGKAVALDLYNNNSPFEERGFTLLALVVEKALFGYIDRVRTTLRIVSVLSLAFGVLGLALTSRRFARPITALSERVRGMKTQADLRLEHVGVSEIDQLVDALEEMNRNVGRSSARTEFFSRMSHDMRTPMNAIISFSSPELLENVSEDVKDDYFKKIHSSGMFLLALINEVLDITKIDSNKTELRADGVDASRLFDTTVSIIEKLASQKRIAFSVDMEIPPDTFVIADVQHINQIVMNLLSNAVKFTPEGGAVRLSASLSGAEDAEHNALCRIVVSDNGVGMSEDFQKHLYTPFEQENSQREGTGLGLSIARKLIELMGGTIDCQSKKGFGTTFSIMLPLKRTYPVDTSNATLGLESGNRINALKGRRVLVCEDNSINFIIVQRLLEKWGASVELAKNGKLGLEMFAASKPGRYDAILMDVQMPVMDGLSAAAAIRALNRPDAAKIPIIAMTANAFIEDVESSRAAGMDAHLSKPVDPALFFDTLFRLWNRS